MQDDWSDRLDEVLSDLAGRRPSRIIDFKELYDALRPPGARALAKALTARVLTGRLDVVWRVFEPETGELLKEYNNLENVPRSFEDDLGHEVMVDPRANVRTFYRLAPAP